MKSRDKKSILKNHEVVEQKFHPLSKIQLFQRSVIWFLIPRISSEVIYFEPLRDL